MFRTAAVVVLLGWTAVAAGANWPAWRGPTGQGFCDEMNVPLKWSKTENVKWKVPLADQGNSTPVIWGSNIFLTQANKGGSIRSLLCLSRADGKLIWQKDVMYPGKEQNWNESWYANASPAVDGERVIVSFASAGMYCYDFDGKELWKRTDLGNWQHAFGNGSSPVLYGDLCILWVGPNAHPDADDQDKQPAKDKDGKKVKGPHRKGPRNVLLAVDKKTGKTVWETDEKHGSWSTPLIVKVNGQDQLILGFGPDAKNVPDPPENFLKGYDPKTGKELWFCRGLNSFVYTSPLYGNGVVVQMCGYGGSALAVKLGGAGDITKDRLWLHPKNIQRVGSGMIIGDHVYMVDENGTPRCYELTTGKDVWAVEKRPGSGATWGSMVHAAGRLYVLMRNGETLVFKASPKYELITINSLPGAQTNSSIAISNGEIFIRTFQHLWCISDKK
jgi:outer membrane protein assembly factor BamB